MAQTSGRLFERKLRIVLDWTVALFFHYDIVKLDLFGERHPLRQAGAFQPTDAAAGGEQQTEQRRVSA